MAAYDAARPAGHGASMPGTKPGTDHEVDHHADHPGERIYINVALILVAVTAIEVAIYYIDALSGILVPALLILSLFKFVAVVGYFMHLKMDDVRFRWMFLAGLIISSSVVLALLALFWTDTYYMPLAEPVEQETEENRAD